ncbi:hypothetical protein AOQ84DRAFT_259008, partial [Glonium stellatum]
ARVLVVARLSSENVDWLQEELPDVPTAVYTVDDPTAPLHPPENKGREAMVYLSYLIDHYDNLPDEMIFLHYHRWAWHNNDVLQSDIVETITRLSSSYVQREGYVNLRCHSGLRCTHFINTSDPETWPFSLTNQNIDLIAVFQELFPGHRVPETVAHTCCAQFALSKSLALNATRQRYIDLRDWILNNSFNNWTSGYIFELLWHYVFTNKSVVCPRADICYCEAFGICFGSDSQLTVWSELRDKQRKLQSVLNLLEAEENEEQKDRGPTGNITSELREKIQKVGDQLEARLTAAKRRGEDPGNRATDSWKASKG